LSKQKEIILFPGKIGERDGFREIPGGGREEKVERGAAMNRYRQKKYLSKRRGSNALAGKMCLNGMK